ncbi:hypothetical protein ACGFYU_02500 [Streptomyces sp. NPDC048337]|uniref:hypothetical protein n=1 Tax=Streptomyces sp. NPDC048337 TaxID=3365535 RepID=UPI003721F6A8
MHMPSLRLLFAVLLVSPALGGCALFGPYPTCEGTESAVAELAKLPGLELRPERARPVGAAPGAMATASCTADSGDAYLTAERLYSYDGSRAEVLEYYGRAAPAAGWRPVGSLDFGPDSRAVLFCFESKDRPSITLQFLSAQQLRDIHGVDPGPESTGSGGRTLFSLSAEAATDGSRIGCV